MLIYHIDAIGFVMILSKEFLNSNKIFIKDSIIINKENFIKIAKIFIYEIRKKYAFNFSNKNIRIKINAFPDGCVSILEYQDLCIHNFVHKYKVKPPYISFYNYRNKIIVLFNKINDLINCLVALHDTMERFNIPFDLLENKIYLKNSFFILFLNKKNCKFSQINEICQEYGKTIRYNKNFLAKAVLLDIKDPIKALGKS